MLTKFGTGDVIGPDDDDLKKTAKPEWTDKDAKELSEENGDEPAE